jgi:hypothetical protein
MKIFLQWLSGAAIIFGMAVFLSALSYFVGLGSLWFNIHLFPIKYVSIEFFIYTSFFFSIAAIVELILLWILYLSKSISQPRYLLGMKIFAIIAVLNIALFVYLSTLDWGGDIQ